MKKIYFVLAVLLCAVMILTVPVGAEDEPSPVPDVTEGEETGGESPTPSEDEGAEWNMEEVKAYINGTVIPAAVMVVTALAALYVALVPVFNKVKSVIAKFNQASDDITATAGESELTKKNTKAALDKLSGEYTQLLSQNKKLQENYTALEAVVKAALADMKANVSGEMAAVKSMAGQIEKMLIIGFCNNKELMDKGYARKIAELGSSVNMVTGERTVGDAGPYKVTGEQGAAPYEEKEEGNEQGNIEGGA